MTGARIAVPLGLAVALGLAALTIVPAGFDAEELLASQEDPVALADHAIARTFDAGVAAREINAALAANDPDLAQSFLELARDRKVPVDAALAAKVEAANAGAATAQRSLESFARGFVTGEPEDLSGLAGTAFGDLFVFGDIRDAVREGTRLASGQQADELILGLACVGLAVTAGTYASVGLAAPARIGVTVVKAARKTGRIGAGLVTWISRSLREIIDWSALQRAITGAKVTDPAIAVRAAREAVKVEKAQGLVRLVSDVGRVQAKAGTQAALDGLKLAQGPRDMSRLARLAAAKGGKTRAILKLAGRGAILLTVSTFNLAMWLFWAALTLFGFVSSLKRTTERATERYCLQRKRRRARAREREEAEKQERYAREQRAAELAAAAAEPPVIYSTAPGFAPSIAPAAPAREPPPPPPEPALPKLEPDDRVAIKRPPWPGLTVPRQPAGPREPLESTALSFRSPPKARAGGS
jgi:hypothetical protein